MDNGRIEVDGIPANLYSSGGESGLLLLGHGGGYSKDGSRYVALCRRYAAETDLAVVCMDAVDHGERAPVAPESDGIPVGWHSNSADQMVADWGVVVDSLSSIGPPLAYVGFSMGAIFGFPIVAAMASIRVATLVAGGIPSGGGINDPALPQLLLENASRLGDRAILMHNKRDDDIFSIDDSSRLFAAIPPGRSQLKFSDGDHNDWPPELISETINFIAQHLDQSGQGSPDRSY